MKFVSLYTTKSLFYYMLSLLFSQGLHHLKMPHMVSFSVTIRGLAAHSNICTQNAPKLHLLHRSIKQHKSWAGLNCYYYFPHVKSLTR